MQKPLLKPSTSCSTAKFEQLCTSLKLATKLPSKHSTYDMTGQLECITGQLGPKRLVDCLASSTGSGAGLVGMHLCTQAWKHSGEFVVVDATGTFFPPAAPAWGVDAKRLLVVRPKTNQDGIAAAELALRSPAAAAVWASLDRVDPKSFRRLQLAAESADAFGVLVRPARYQPDPSWSDVQIRCDPMPSIDAQADQLLVRLSQTRNRHGPVSGEVTISMDWQTGTIQEWIDHDEPKNFSTHPVPLASQLASTALPPKAS